MVDRQSGRVPNGATTGGAIEGGSLVAGQGQIARGICERFGVLRQKVNVKRVVLLAMPEPCVYTMLQLNTPMLGTRLKSALEPLRHAVAAGADLRKRACLRYDDLNRRLGVWRRPRRPACGAHGPRLMAHALVARMRES